MDLTELLEEVTKLLLGVNDRWKVLYINVSESLQNAIVLFDGERFAVDTGTIKIDAGAFGILWFFEPDVGQAEGFNLAILFV